MTKYRIRCPICKSLMWSSQLEKKPNKVEFLKQESKGGRSGFVYHELKHKETPRKKFKNYFLEVINQLISQGILTTNDLAEIYKKSLPKKPILEEEAKTEYQTSKELAKLEAEASKTAKAEKEAKTELETMKKQAEQEIEAEKNLDKS